jgi:alkylation response protein AidB-like acyl-CoA dehydrogenase
MDLSLNPEQTALRDSLRHFLRDCYPLEARTRASRDGAGWRPEIWQRLGQELGILGAAFPEELGGSGGGAVEHMVIQEELGAVLALEPYLESVVIGGGLLRQAGGPAARAVLQTLLSGAAAVAVGLHEAAGRYALGHVATTARREGGGWRLDGAKVAVAAAPWSRWLIVSARTAGAATDAHGISLFLVERDRPGVSLCEFHTLDGRRAADVVLDGVTLPAGALLGEAGGALAPIEQVADAAIAALGAEAVGLMDPMLRQTVEYTGQRQQFGQRLSSFQALQHRMADMLMQLELARSAVYGVTLALDAPAEERALAASAAKVTVDRALRFVGQNAVQLHGGMGMSDEVPVTLYFRRATVIANLFGSTDHHLGRFARLSRHSRSD